MARPVTLFTGQWADLPLKELAPLAKSMGYDGLELACWGDHFNVQEALASGTYVKDKRALLAQTACNASPLAITSSARRCAT
jgi:sugar phosphate isomerase/epimerase